LLQWPIIVIFIEVIIVFIKEIQIKNFRLLQDISISLDKESTIIVGRNNTGKTSLTEFFRRLSLPTPIFQLEDFSLNTITDFWDTYLLFIHVKDEDEIRSLIPEITLIMTVDYTKDKELGMLSELIIDLDPSNYLAKVKITYRLKDGAIKEFFKSFEDEPSKYNNHPNKAFCRILKEQIPRRYAIYTTVIDPTDITNWKDIDVSIVRKLISSSFITAQRGLDDTTIKENDILGKTLVKLLSTAQNDDALTTDQKLTRKIERSIELLQERVDRDFNNQVNELLPALSLLGYPGLGDPGLHTETLIEVGKFMETHTKIRYKTDTNQGISLPESYNGLGSRNLIYILFRLYQHFKEFVIAQPRPKAHLLFIEEPEAHLHPQMQEIFIKQLTQIATIFMHNYKVKEWPVQFIVTTHSTHIANEAPFDKIRYFMNKDIALPSTKVKDLSVGLGGESYKKDREFLQKYLTLTRCDLFFADKAILVEGQSEHILLPKMINKMKGCLSNSLNSQYISIVEIGGAYAHHFYPLLDFLELKTLVITDLDSTHKEKRKRKDDKTHTCYTKCQTSNASHTSNAGLKQWFNIGKQQIELSVLRSKNPSEKIQKRRRIAFQIPEDGYSACARSFEDAFILANPLLFDLDSTEPQFEKKAIEKAVEVEDKKLDFAIEYAINKINWEIPLYIKEGLEWLCDDTTSISGGAENNV
jgi:predicted ATP-dependent endonuclease of OLD family